MKITKKKGEGFIVNGKNGFYATKNKQWLHVGVGVDHFTFKHFTGFRNVNTLKWKLKALKGFIRWLF
jgi:hypothetical protein